MSYLEIGSVFMCRVRVFHHENNNNGHQKVLISTITW